MILKITFKSDKPPIRDFFLSLVFCGMFECVEARYPCRMPVFLNYAPLETLSQCFLGNLESLGSASGWPAGCRIAACMSLILAQTFPVCLESAAYFCEGLNMTLKCVRNKEV